MRGSEIPENVHVWGPKFSVRHTHRIACNLQVSQPPVVFYANGVGGSVKTQFS